MGTDAVAVFVVAATRPAPGSVSEHAWAPGLSRRDRALVS